MKDTNDAIFDGSDSILRKMRSWKSADGGEHVQSRMHLFCTDLFARNEDGFKIKVK